jgi:hypothetical protein
MSSETRPSPAPPAPPPLPSPPGAVGAEVAEEIVARLLRRHGAGAGHDARIRRGVAQVAARWWPEDGDAGELAAFCEATFHTGTAELERAFARLEQVMEQVDGHLHEVRRELLAPIEVDRGPAAPVTEVDRLLAHLDLAPHVDENLFRTRVAFFALLNFPVHTLRERLAESAGWDRAAWARSRMMDRFASRVPAAVAQAASWTFTAAEEYISGYNIRLDRLLTPRGERPFPEGLRLISHWGLRGGLAAPDADGHQRGSSGSLDAGGSRPPGESTDTAGSLDAGAVAPGLLRQRLILEVMERIVRQEIPAAVIDNPDLLWDPESNLVRPTQPPAAGGTGGATAAAALSEQAAGRHEGGEGHVAAREPDSRYAQLLAIFRAQRAIDPYTPAAPSLPARRFDLERQIPEAEVEALLVSVLEAAEVDDLARLIARRLGRPLEPFDIWYSGFKSRGGHGEAELDARVRAVFPSLAAFQAALPRQLVALGFSAERAAWLAERIAVDRARGAGHAMGAVRREDRAHLRTRVGDGGMDYKGYNVAMHELGHNVEQVFSLAGVDHWWLAGVPNNAFTEAFAFLFQERDLEALELAAADAGSSAAPAAPGGKGGTTTVTDRASAPAERHRDRTLATLWNTYEIAGVSLVDMRVWRWLYDHSDAGPAALREAVLAIAREVWNRYFAPRLGHPGCEILAIYSHMIVYSLYLPDYALGHIIAFQLAARLRGQRAPDQSAGLLGSEIERMACQGRLTPDAWMRGAVGGPVSAEALLAAARGALAAPDVAAAPDVPAAPAAGDAS